MLFILIACFVVFVLVYGTTKHQPRSSKYGLSQMQTTDPSLFSSIPGVDKIRKTQKAKQLRMSCLRQMPQFIDVLVLGLSAGLSFDSALDLYCKKFSTDLSDLLFNTQLKWQIGVETRQEALSGLSDEVDIEVMKRFSEAVCESLEFGTPLASVLQQQAKMLRDYRHFQIEEEIEKVPVKMIIPLGTLIVPAMLLAILGPLLSGSLGIGM